MKKDLVRKWDGLTRRQFAAGAAKTFLGVSIYNSLGSAAFAADSPGETTTVNQPVGKATRCIYLYMSGGMSHIDTFDPKPGTDVQGPTKVINTNVAGIRVGAGLSKTAKLMNEIAVVNSMRTTSGAHEQGNYIMHTSYAMRGTIRHPGIGSWLLHFEGKLNKVLPGNVIVNGGSANMTSGFLPSVLAPLPIGNPRAGLPYGHRNVSESEFMKRLELADAYDRPFRSSHSNRLIKGYTNLYADAIKLMNSKETEVFDITKESPAVLANYGDNSFGQGCLLARRLVQNDVRFVEVGLGGWDTHTDNFNTLDDKVPMLDQAIAALLTDLKASGLLDTTLVALGTEFGRSPRINGSQGRDHHPLAFSCMLAGGGIKGGQAIGKTDATGYHVEEGETRVEDFNATIAAALNMPLKTVVKSPSGRPFTVANKGKVITGVL